MHELSIILIILPPNVFQKMLRIDSKTALCVKPELCGSLIFLRIWFGIPHHSARVDKFEVWTWQWAIRFFWLHVKAEEINSFWWAVLAFSIICMFTLFNHEFDKKIIFVMLKFAIGPMFHRFQISLRKIFYTDVELKRMQNRKWLKKRYFLLRSK